MKMNSLRKCNRMLDLKNWGFPLGFLGRGEPVHYKKLDEKYQHEGMQG